MVKANLGLHYFTLLNHLLLTWFTGVDQAEYAWAGLDVFLFSKIAFNPQNTFSA